MTEIRVPTLGESVTEATIGKWFKKAGDPVAVDEPLVELETDKVTIEVPAPAAGVLGCDRRAGRRDGRGRRAARSDHGRRGRGAAKPPAADRPADQKTATTAPIGAADEEPQPRVPPKAMATQVEVPATCRCRLRCASSRPKPASSRRPSRAPARTAASPRATCWRRSSARRPRRRPSRSPRPRSRRARRRRPTTHRAKSA